MRIGDSRYSYYSSHDFYRQKTNQTNEEAVEVEQSARPSGAALEPTKTPSSISNVMWMRQSGTANATDQAVINEFMTWSKMDMAEKIRAEVLASKNLTEDGLKSLPEDERKAVEDEIAKTIKQRLGGRDEDQQDEPPKQRPAAYDLSDFE